ncbi:MULTISPECIES: hypothetical protein [Halomonas]|uniref:AsmA-like C-terminal domain-containing protein n=1 Tax=Halomonas halophila TaxID=29573 RepID=A0ABQ0U1F0_9GAMM|nr:MULTISPECIES: hypothetical protein [Halomonas]MDR5888862.1 hypothetical protein [Halomonas salina]WJY08040.1 hypothetical protein QWG60_03795 [Halomonas halophila]GEK72182.1 hypothetical protein HHA04nite_07260 [Halomonas halophila]
MRKSLMRNVLMRKSLIRQAPSRGAVLAAFLAVLPCGLAQADAERLEADLRERFAAAGEFSIGEVSDSLLGGETRAEDLSLVDVDGSRLDVARYVVEGDYEDPEAIVMEGLRLERTGRDAGVLTADRLRLDGPGGPLPWHEGRLGDAAFEADALSAEGLRLALESGLITSADGKKTLSPQVSTSGWLTAQRLEAEGLTATGVGRLEMSGIEGHAERLEDLGAGDLTLASLSLEGLSHPPGDPEAATLDRFELNDMSIVADHLVADLARLSVDGDMHDGEGRARLEALELDLARMIELAPAEERTRLRLASNVLTGGSGQLRLDAEFDGRWEALGQKSLLSGDGTITAADAFRWAFDSELPVRLPEGVEPAAYLAEMTDLSGVTLLGGRIETTLGDLGLFGRVPAVMAASRGVSEAEFLDQARTQARGFGTMLGPEFGQLLDGLVDMMAGRASEVTVALTLPPESDADVLAADPLGLPSKLSMAVETR